jgi:hypothetical protein
VAAARADEAEKRLDLLAVFPHGRDNGFERIPTIMYPTSSSGEPMSRYHNQFFWPLGLLAAGLAAAFAGLRTATPVSNTISFHDDFESGSLEAWQMPHAEDWEILAEDQNHFLHMKRSREPGVPRRPLQFALLAKVKVGSFDFQTRVRREGRSMILVFNYVDTLHFYYVHLSGDRATQEPVHNGIFIVNGGPRKRISGIEAPPALPDRAWHQVRLVRDVPTGSVEVFVDRDSQPLFSVADRTFGCGQIGIGSFDETGDFDNIQLTSNDAGCATREQLATRVGKIEPPRTHAPQGL